MWPVVVDALRRCGMAPQAAPSEPETPLARVLLLDGSAWLRQTPTGQLQSDLVVPAAVRYGPCLNAVLALDTAASLPLHTPVSKRVGQAENTWSMTHGPLTAASLATMDPGTLDQSPLLQWQYMRAMASQLSRPPGVERLCASPLIPDTVLDDTQIRMVYDRIRSRLAGTPTWAALDMVGRDRLLTRAVAQEIVQTYTRVMTWVRDPDSTTTATTTAVPPLVTRSSQAEPAPSLAKLWMYAMAALRRPDGPQVVLVSPRPDILVHAVALVTVVLRVVRPGRFWVQVPVRAETTTQAATPAAVAVAVVDVGLFCECIGQHMAAHAPRQHRPVALWCLLAMLARNDAGDLGAALWNTLPTVPTESILAEDGRFVFAVTEPSVVLRRVPALDWYKAALYQTVPALSGQPGQHRGLVEWTTQRRVHGWTHLPVSRDWLTALHAATTAGLNVLTKAWYAPPSFYHVDLHQAMTTGFVPVAASTHSPEHIQEALARGYMLDRHSGRRMRFRLDLSFAQTSDVLLVVLSAGTADH